MFKLFLFIIILFLTNCDLSVTKAEQNHAPVDNVPLKQLLTIKDQHGNELEYKGIMAKLSPATISKSFQLKPGENLEFFLNLTALYDLDEKNLGDLSTRYKVINQVEGIDDDIEITSNWFKLSSQ